MKSSCLKSIKALLVAFGVMGLSSGISYAGEPVTASVGADLVSSYLWRGQKLDDVSIQPSLALDWGGFSLSSWGSVGFQGDYKEFDFTLSYSIGGFSILATDYFCADSYMPYFDYSSDGGHFFELGASYDFGPVAFSWYSILLGATGCNSKGDDVISSYFEVSAPFKLGGLDWSAAIGGTPTETSMYASTGFAITNISVGATKEVEIGGLTLPIFAKVIANPCSDKLFLCAGISF